MALFTEFTKFSHITGELEIQKCFQYGWILFLTIEDDHHDMSYKHKSTLLVYVAAFLSSQTTHQRTISQILEKTGFNQDYQKEFDAPMTTGNKWVGYFQPLLRGLFRSMGAADIYQSVYNVFLQFLDVSFW